MVRQSDNMLFRQIRLITGDRRDYNPYIVFVDCKGWQSRKNELRHILYNGFRINDELYVLTERSASMSRNSVLGFVNAEIEPELNRRITMDMDVKTTVLAKLMAYRGLFFSGCFCLENWYPRIVIVDDYNKTIPNQHIKYLVDVEREYINRNGETFTWREKGIKEDFRDVEITLWDGSGIHSPEVTQYVKRAIKSEETPTSILWRLPYMKGMTHEVNFRQWFAEHNINNIKDIFGIEHNIQDVDMIVTNSFYKGYGYFKQYGDGRDWRLYWNKFRQYNHCVGVASWNYSFDNEPRMTKTSYQILQDLDLEFEDFIQIAEYSMSWIEKIISGEPVYAYCFLGLFAEHVKPSNEYMEAVVKNPEMLKEPSIRKYLIDLLRKNIDLMKCGKLYVEGAFKFVVTDLIMFLQYISGMESVGVLGEDEFYSVDADGVCLGERVIERNPHISREEHLILQGVNHPLLEKYCSHLANVCQINGHSISLRRLNGADEDGDRVLVINNNIIKSGINRNLPIVIDMEDKITALEEEFMKENIVECTLRSMVDLIGEASNCATSYHNKTPQTKEQKQKYLEYINILSIVNGKAIDYAKTGVLFNIPRHMAKYSKPLPYFMKYAGDYYSNLKKFNRSPSNMNRLCWVIERWHKKIRFKQTFDDFDYRIMVDESIPFDERKFKRLERLYLHYLKTIQELGKQSALSKSYENYKYYFDDDLTKEEVLNTTINWNYYYERYSRIANMICLNPKELANLIVKLCYEKYPKKNKKFIWIIAGQGILENLKQTKVLLPTENENGQYEYLGRKYSLKEVCDIC